MSFELELLVFLQYVCATCKLYVSTYVCACMCVVCTVLICILIYTV